MTMSDLLSRAQAAVEQAERTSGGDAAFRDAIGALNDLSAALERTADYRQVFAIHAAWYLRDAATMLEAFADDRWAAGTRPATHKAIGMARRAVSAGAHAIEYDKLADKGELHP